MLNRRRSSSQVIAEAVESRLHLAAATVTGSSGADEIRVTTSFSTIVVEVNGLPQSYPTVIYDSLLIEAQGNADTIFIDSNDGIPITINGGNGDDEIHFAEASGTLNDTPSSATLQASSGNDTLFLHDDNGGGTYSVTGNRVTRPGFAGVVQNNVAKVKLTGGGGVDTFNIVNGTATTFVLEAGGGADVLNLGSFGNPANVSFDNSQDFANIQTEVGSTLSLLDNSGLFLTTNQSNVEGNTTLGTGYIVERNSLVAGGLGYWRERLQNGQTPTTPSLISTFAASSAINDAIGYAYADDLTITELDGFPIQDGDLVLRYTLRGDANLDKVVGFDDLVSLAQNYQGAGFREWYQGDFNLTRSVNFDDLVSLAQNYGATATAFASLKASPAAKVVSIDKKRSDRVPASII